MMSKIYLVGFMGVGKSTAGRKLAQNLNYDFLDLDDVFEEKYKISIQNFFKKYGEELFRKLEYQLLTTTFSLENVVISTGGGTVVYEDAMELMNKNGLTVYLEMPFGAIVERLKKVKKKRPLIHGSKNTDMERVISERMEERLPYYRKAKIIVNVADLNIDALAERIQQEILK